MREQLLRNVFPAIVLRRLQDKTRVSSAVRAFCREVPRLHLPFAVVGLQQVTTLGETGQAEPTSCMPCGDLDRFDGLADTFKVQKVRKTVNEYYMVAAGLPDPTVLPAQKERALALVSLAFSMVHIMDVINTDPVIQDIGVELSCQVGIHSGDAIAGVIGQKRFQYDLCGDAVNKPPLCSIQAWLLTHADHAAPVQGHYGAYRGEQAVKGKGNMKPTS